MVALAGEPGIGKSRLLFEFRQSLDAEPLTYLEGRGESYGGGVPYLPVIDLLRRFFQIEERDDPATAAETVRSRLLALDVALAPDIPPLLALLGTPGAGREWPSLEPTQRRQRILDALRRFVLCVSRTGPVLLAIEDVHWIDAETQAFLDRLAVSLMTARVLVVVTHRPEYRHPVGPTSYTQLHLDPLAPASAGLLARTLLGDDRALAPLTRLLIERTEGNPFFLEESVRTLVETGGLVGERGAYRPGSELHRPDVPPTVRAVLAARIDRLAPEERHVVRAAAVVGRDVLFPLLQAIADTPEATLRGILADLQGAELLRETRLVPEAEYSFKHALTHEVAYDTLPPERRRALHARVVDALERASADRPTEHVERLAHHAVAAELWSKALAYCRQAGARAAWQSAHRAAVQYFEQALGAIARLPQASDVRKERLDLQMQLRWSLVPLGEYAKLARTLRDAAGLAESLDDRRRLGEISQSMINFLRTIGDGDGALAAGRRVIAIAAETGDEHLATRARFQLGLVHRQLGQFAPAIDALRHVVAALHGDLLLERFGEPSVLSVHARSWLAMTLAEVGRFPEAVAAGEDAIRIAEIARNGYSVTNAHLGLGMSYARQGRVDRATPLLERAVTLCREGNFHVLLPPAASALGRSLTLAGRLSEALPLLELAVETAARRGMAGNSALYLTWLGHARLLAERMADAHELALRALEAARKHGERGNEAGALALRAEVSARVDPGDLAVAARQHETALALARTLGMKPLVAHGHEALGRLHAAMGRQDLASEHRTMARALRAEMQMMSPLPLPAGA
jgi:tetratricopeptide (TPR) repeat protein